MGMQNKLKKHQSVRLLRDPDPEYVEYHGESEDNFKEIPIKKGMTGRVNVILSNGRYHVEIFDDEGKVIAYAPMNEEDLEEVKEKK